MVLDVRTELNIGGTWTNVSSYVLAGSNIDIKRGRSSETSSVEPSSLSLTFDNTDGRFSPRNPTGAYYGSIGRNTPIRTSIPNGSSYLSNDGTDSSRATTPDAAVLDITGDIDIRIDLTLDTWRSLQVFCGKYEITGDQRSWAFDIQEGGQLALFWSPDGTLASRLDATSTEPVPIPGDGRRAVRVTLDVNNGAAGHTATFYYADTISGSWTQLGDAVVTSGTTSIFSGTGVLEVGGSIDLQSNSGAVGRVNAFQLRNGINGTLVANPDFTIQTAGDILFTDTTSSPRTWSIGSAASIDDRDYRFWGEVSSWPPSQDLSGNYKHTSIEAAGLIRRLGQGASPLNSAIFRDMINPARTNIVAYWPCEDPEGSSFLYSPLNNSRVVLAGDPTLASFDRWQGSAPLPVMNTGKFSISIPAYTSTGENSVRFLTAIPEGGAPSTVRIAEITTVGTIKRWTLDMNSSNFIRLQGLDVDGVSVVDTGLLNHSIPDGSIHLCTLEFTQDGADVDWRIITTPFSDVIYITNIVGTFVTSGTAASNTVSKVSKIIIAPDSNLTDFSIGHIAVADELTAFANTVGPLTGWRGETPIDRIVRICSEEEIDLRLYEHNESLNVTTMGIQDELTVLDILTECAVADGGIMFEPTDRLGIAYRGRRTLYSQEPVLTLDHSANEIFEPLIPTEDDQITRNDVTVSRPHGSFSRSVLESGTLSVQEPPNGVGRYDDNVSVNVGDDEELPDQARWRRHLGTVDEARYPGVTVNLSNARITADTALSKDVKEADIGDRILVTNPPDYLPPDDIEQLVNGINETLNNFEHIITFNGTPESPYHVGKTETSGTTSTTSTRAGTDSSTLAEDLTNSETGVDVLVTPGSALWSESASDFDVIIGGERMTVTSVTGSHYDNFGRSVSSGWGTSDSGHAWTNTGGSASNYSVTSSQGRHTNSTVNVSRLTTMSYSYDDFDVYCKVTANALSTGGTQFAYVVGRYTDTSNMYYVRVDFATTGALTFSLRKRVAGVDTELDTFSPSETHVAGTFVNTRFQAIGTSLKGRFWTVGGLEPTVWHVEATDPDHTSGSLGCRSVVSSSNTNVNPVLAFDDFKNVYPQTLNVTRSVNGVVKTHSTGADVKLFKPHFVAL